MDVDLLYFKLLSLKAQGKRCILVLTKETIKELVTTEMPEVDIDSIDKSNIWFAGIRVYLGTMNQLIFY